jgi:hypothetical protein
LDSLSEFVKNVIYVLERISFGYPIILFPNFGLVPFAG